MERRILLKSAAALAASAGIAGVSPVRAIAGGTSAGDARAKARGAWIQASDGTHLFLRDWGTGEPVVFAAPWALNTDWWEYQMSYLAGHGLRCIGYDRRGHGRSGEPSSGYDFDTLADDMAGVMDQLDLHDVTMVGQSMGCGEIVRYLSRHGSSRVARVVLVSTITPFIMKTADNPDGVDETTLEQTPAALGMDRAHVITAAVPSFFGEPINKVSPEMADWWVRMMVDRCSLRIMIDLQRMFTRTDFRPELRAMTVPTLLIHGDHDASTPIELTGRKTAKLIPGCELKVYENAAHGLPITHKDRLNADLLAFAKA
jgi:pimeloyl-ACP methyl ester carboxylesterase